MWFEGINLIFHGSFSQCLHALIIGLPRQLGDYSVALFPHSPSLQQSLNTRNISLGSVFAFGQNYLI